jgi:hypothetical protein
VRKDIGTKVLENKGLVPVATLFIFFLSFTVTYIHNYIPTLHSSISICRGLSGKQRKHGFSFVFNILCEEEHSHQKSGKIKKAWHNTEFVFNIGTSEERYCCKILKKDNASIAQSIIFNILCE